MSNPLIVQEAFNAGELSPDVAARFGLRDYLQGCAVLENMIARPEGPGELRPGARHIAPAKASAAGGHNLLPFEFSADEDQTYAIEAGEQYFRFYRLQARIGAAATDASIANGDFATDLTDWDGISTGAAAIAHEILGADIEGTFDKPNAANAAVGDSQVNGINWGLKFNNTTAGSVRKARLDLSSATAAFNAHAAIYTDSSGSPGVQVGGNSATVNLNAAGVHTFTWSAAPSVSAATDYWLVFIDTTLAGVGDVNINLCADQGSAFASGTHDIVTTLADGFGSIALAHELRAEILVETANSEPAMALEGNAGDTAIAEQDVTVSTGLNVEHVLTFRLVGTYGGGSVLGGATAADKIKLRIGTTTGGDQVLEDLELGVGFHAIAFTPAVSPFFVQFRNELGKTLHIDDVVLLDDAPLELPTPYRENDVAALQYTQSNDVLWLTCGQFTDSANKRGYPLQRLERRGHTTWSLVEVFLKDGPWLDENGDTGLTLQPSATSGLGITITAAGHAPFNVNEWAGRLIRLKHSSTWGYAIITERLSATQVKADIKSDFGGTGAVSAWRLGVFSTVGGQPRAVALHDQRLCLAGADAAPGEIAGSKVAQLDVFTPGADDDDPFQVVIDGDRSPLVQWIASQGKRIFAGGLGRLYSVESNTIDGPLTPAARIEKHSYHGSDSVQPVVAGSDLVYVARHGRKLRAVEFDVLQERFKAKNRTRLCGHVTASGIKQLAYMDEPFPVLWALRNDGVLVALTYEADEEANNQPIVAAARQLMAAPEEGTGGAVKAAVVIAGASSGELWQIVRRTIDGAAVSHIELMEAPYDRDSDAKKDAKYLDAALTFSGTLTSVTVAHLANEDALYANADGAEIGPLTADGSGLVSLGATYSDVVIGLKKTWKLQPMRPAPQMRTGNGLFRGKQHNVVVVDVEHSQDIQVGDPATGTFFDVEFGGAGLYTGIVEQSAGIEQGKAKENTVQFKGSGVLPVKIRAFQIELDVGESSPA